jgi:hypothetical protein
MPRGRGDDADRVGEVEARENSAVVGRFGQVLDVE